MTMATARDIRVPDGGSESVRRIHALFQETLGNDAVEDLVSFRLTVSPSTNPALAPKLVEAYEGNRLIGAVLGVYLRRVNGGMVLYAGVREPYRRQGLYTEMRNTLLSALAAESPTGLAFVLGEVEDGLAPSEVSRRVGGFHRAAGLRSACRSGPVETASGPRRRATGCRQGRDYRSPAHHRPRAVHECLSRRGT